MVRSRVATTHMFRNDLRRYMGKNRLYPLLEHQTLDTVPWADDFLGSTIRTEYTVANGGGSSAASPVVQAGTLNGIARFVTGTSGNSTASSELALGLTFRGDQSAVVVACLKVSSISAVKIEVGFTDALADAGAVATKATPTFNADDCAVWIFDTVDNANWEGVAANNKDTSPATTLEAGISPVADTYEWLMVELHEFDESNNVTSITWRRFTQAGGQTFSGITQSAGPNANVLLTPWIYVQAHDGTSKNLDVDYFGAWQRRTT